MGLYLDITKDPRLTGESHILLRIAQHFQAEQRIDPLVDSLKETLLTAIFATFLNNDVATAAGPESQTVHNGAWSGIQLDAVFLSHIADVFTFLNFRGDFLVNEGDFGHSWRLYGSVGEKRVE